MSIYSGFATRHQQQTYDGLTEDLIYVLQKRLLKFYNKDEADQSKFLSILSQIYGNLIKMEENKYLQPKMSRIVEDLLKFLTNKEIKELRNIDKPYTTPIKPLTAMPIRFKSKVTTNRDSFAKLNEPSSVGKIVKQINNHDNTSSLNESRNIFNQVQKPEDNPQTKEHDFSIQKLKLKQNFPQNRIHEYLQKSKKSYLRGYRKRQMKSKAFSSKDGR